MAEINQQSDLYKQAEQLNEKVNQTYHKLLEARKTNDVDANMLKSAQETFLEAFNLPIMVRNQVGGEKNTLNTILGQMLDMGYFIIKESELPDHDPVKETYRKAYFNDMFSDLI